MNLQPAWLPKPVGLLGAGVLVLWRRTLALRLRNPTPDMNPLDPQHEGFIFAAWHESILGFAFFGLPYLRKCLVMISKHRDGEYISQIVEKLGAQTVRGSTTRGGRAGLLEMMHADRHMSLAITPDGPKGPRRHFQPGAIFLASQTGLPLVPLGFGFTNAWRARSWDRFAVPMPYSCITCVAGMPIHLPHRLKNEDLENWRLRVEDSLLNCTHQAEQWAAEMSEQSSAKLAA